DDYAHHPVEMEATIAAARRGWPEHKIAVVMQPHRFSRLQFLWGDFVRVLGKADLAVILPVYAAGEPSLAGISGENLFVEAQARHPKLSVAYAESEEEISAALKQWVASEDLALPVQARGVRGDGATSPKAMGQRSPRMKAQKTMILFLGAGDITKMARKFAKRVL
ncbi:MAG: cyanophycin synthetase, partial [bacterium]|nr:cyanophycin synthetase [bacterium]